jgi:enamine deaminase RidA (YjgF/YER057c/UK114 family)
MMGAEARLQELGIELPKPPEPVANYVRAKQVGSLLFVAGHGPAPDEGGRRVTGKVGGDLSVDEGYRAARLVGLNLLASVRAELGSLDRVKQIVKVLGMVNCAPGFDQTPRVINGCSDLFVEVFGEEAGRHARSAVGMAELPSTIPVEIEMIVEVE